MAVFKERAKNPSFNGNEEIYSLLFRNEAGRITIVECCVAAYDTLRNSPCGMYA